MNKKKLRQTTTCWSDIVQYCHWAWQISLLGCVTSGAFRRRNLAVRACQNVLQNRYKRGLRVDVFNFDSEAE
jgi:hypothetical protein